MTTHSTVLPDNEQTAMSPKLYLSRILAKEAIDCPSCGKNLRVSTLAWAHHCKRPVSDATIHVKLAKMRGMAVKRFENRTDSMVERTTDPIDTDCQPLE